MKPIAVRKLVERLQAEGPPLNSIVTPSWITSILNTHRFMNSIYDICSENWKCSIQNIISQLKLLICTIFWISIIINENNPFGIYWVLTMLPSKSLGLSLSYYVVCKLSCKILITKRRYGFELYQKEYFHIVGRLPSAERWEHCCFLVQK